MGKTDSALIETEVKKLEKVSRDSYIIEFDRFFDFEHGQVLKLSSGDACEPRLYSIASGQHDPMVQILFNVVDEGQLTPRLSALAPGSRIMVSAGFGKFTGTHDEAWWIAQGTGLAPFLSMLRSGMTDHKVLLHGGRYADSFYFSDELRAALGGGYVPCCSRENGPGLYHGRVTDYLESLHQLPSTALYYLCGSSEMVVESRDILIAKGVGYDRVVSEIYF